MILHYQAKLQILPPLVTLFHINHASVWFLVLPVFDFGLFLFWIRGVWTISLFKPLWNGPLWIFLKIVNWIDKLSSQNPNLANFSASCFFFSFGFFFFKSESNYKLWDYFGCDVWNTSSKIKVNCVFLCPVFKTVKKDKRVTGHRCIPKSSFFVHLWCEFSTAHPKFFTSAKMITYFNYNIWANSMSIATSNYNK